MKLDALTFRRPAMLGHVYFETTLALRRRAFEFEANLGTRHVSVQGQDIRLTPKEFEVLHYLIANANVTIPHGKILQAVWGPDYGNEVEYLHVIINQLRKKIEPDPSKPKFILTEPWFGYRLQFPQD